MKQNLPQICKAYIKPCRLCKFIWSVLIKMNVLTRTVTLSVHYPKYYKLKTWTCSFCGSHKSLWLVSSEGTDIFFEQIYKGTCPFQYKTCFAVKYPFRFLSTQHSLTQISKFKHIFHSSPAFIVHIFIQSKTQHTLMQQNVPLQHQFYWTATDIWMQLSKEICF